MHVIAKDQLLSALETAAPITNRSHVNSLYERVRLTIGKELAFSATDAIITVVGRRDVMMSDGESDFSVNAADVLEAVKRMPDGGVSVHLSPEGVLEVKSGRRHFRAATVAVDDSSPLPDWQGGPPTGIPAAALFEVTRKVQHATGAADARAFDGMLLDMQGGVLKALAFDGYRSAMAYVPVESQEKLEVAVRQQLLPSLLSAVERFPASDVGVSSSPSGLRVDTEVGTFYYAASETRISPATLGYMLSLTGPKIGVVTKVLTDSLKYVAMATTKERPGVTLRGKARGLSLQLSAIDGQRQTDDEVMAEVEEDTEVKVEPPSLIQALGQAGPKAVLMHVRESNCLRVSGDRFEATLSTLAP